MVVEPSTGGHADRAALLALRSAAAVRERCGIVRAYVASGASPHFTLHEDRLPAVAHAIADVTRESYPDLDVPYHSRWRHFCTGAIDRWAAAAELLDGASVVDRARTAIDLAVVSVLLDAGAGDAWTYSEPGTGLLLARSEGLAVASLAMFRAGAYSSDPGRPLQVDGAALAQFDRASLAEGFQAGPGNPLVGLDERTGLLRALGRALQARPDLFGRAARPGHLLDHCRALQPGGHIVAGDILAALLDGLAPVWSSGLRVAGVDLGDAGRHRAVVTEDATNGIVPFHKLSQWLTYSLVEPFEWAGIEVAGLDGLTGLPEYRNGGLLVDLGAIAPREPRVLSERHPVGSELIVEWRALTVALLDDLLPLVRDELDLDDADFPLARMLQGGSWAAGRRIAAQFRPPAGPPPIAIEADGTVF